MYGYIYNRFGEPAGIAGSLLKLPEMPPFSSASRRYAGGASAGFRLRLV